MGQDFNALWRLVMAALVAVAALVFAGPAGAQETSTRETSAQETSAQDAGAGASASEPKVELVMDLSESMLTDDAEGSGTRLDAAKEASTQLVDSMPESAQLGMVVYGSEVKAAADNREEGCQDIKVVSPLQTVDKQALKAEIAKFEAQGYTPIGNALKRAGEELGSDGLRSIVLVSDGVDTCAPPPVCEVAQELADDGVGVTIHTVGFKVDDAAREELQCVAEVSGGTALTANNVDELATAMQELAKRSINQESVRGTPMEFADNPDDAQWLSAGWYQTSVVPSEDREALKYFRVAVPENHNMIVTARAITQKTSEGAGTVGARVLIEDIENSVDDMCFPKVSTGFTADADKNSYQVNTANVATLYAEDPEDTTCDPDNWLVSTAITEDINPAVENVEDFRGKEIPIELAIHFEPLGHVPGSVAAKDADAAVKDAREAAEASDKANGDNPLVSWDGQAEEIVGGAGFEDAIELEPGKVYRDNIVPGENHVYKVDVDWGQRPVFGYRSEADNASRLNAILANPYFGEVNVGAYIPESNEVGEEIKVSRPVLYANRNDDVYGSKIANAGYYYLGLSVPAFESNRDDRGIDMPVEVTVDLLGESAEGPEWRPGTEDGPPPADEPILVNASASSTASASAAPSSEQEAAEDGSSTASETPANAAASADDSGGIMGWAIGLVVVVVIAAGAFFGWKAVRRG